MPEQTVDAREAHVVSQLLVQQNESTAQILVVHAASAGHVGDADVLVQLQHIAVVSWI